MQIGLSGLAWREGDASATGADPEEVRVEEEEQDQRDCHEIHVDAEDDAAVVEAPAALDAADGFRGPDEGDERRQQEQERRLEMREVGQRYGNQDAGEDERVATGQRVIARVEEGVGQDLGRIRGLAVVAG